MRGASFYAKLGCKYEYWKKGSCNVVIYSRMVPIVLARQTHPTTPHLW
jgi:hypothetical protein